MNIDCIYQADAELYVLVYFDLETTGCNYDIKICQIACISPINLFIMHTFFQLSGWSH